MPMEDHYGQSTVQSAERSHHFKKAPSSFPQSKWRDYKTNLEFLRSIALLNQEVIHEVNFKNLKS